MNRSTQALGERLCRPFPLGPSGRILSSSVSSSHWEFIWLNVHRSKVVEIKNQEETHRLTKSLRATSRPYRTVLVNGGAVVLERMDMGVPCRNLVDVNKGKEERVRSDIPDRFRSEIDLTRNVGVLS